MGLDTAAVLDAARGYLRDCPSATQADCEAVLTDRFITGPDPSVAAGAHHPVAGLVVFFATLPIRLVRRLLGPGRASDERVVAAAARQAVGERDAVRSGEHAAAHDGLDRMNKDSDSGRLSGGVNAP